MVTSLTATTRLHTEQNATNEDSNVGGSESTQENSTPGEAVEGELIDKTVRSDVQGEGVVVVDKEESSEELSELAKENVPPRNVSTGISEIAAAPNKIPFQRQPGISPETGTLPSNNDEQPTTTPDAVEEARAPTPTSRTSTPPLSSGSAAPIKKFSSVNVNRQFLKKTVGPTSGVPTSATKINSLTGQLIP